MAATNIELLAAILSVSRRESIKALLTTIYPILSVEDSPVTGSLGVGEIRTINLHFEVPIVQGTVSIQDITKKTVLIEYTETENEVTGTIGIQSIDKTVVLIEYIATESEVTGTIAVQSIEKQEVLISVNSKESAVEGAIAIESITKV